MVRKKSPAVGKRSPGVSKRSPGVGKRSPGVGKRSPGVSKKSPGGRKISPVYFLKKSEKNPVFERCVLAVKKRQSPRCRASKWKSPGCYNPWAVCHAQSQKVKKN